MENILPVKMDILAEIGIVTLAMEKDDVKGFASNNFFLSIMIFIIFTFCGSI